MTVGKEEVLAIRTNRSKRRLFMHKRECINKDMFAICFIFV